MAPPLQLRRAGRSGRQIADELGVSVKSVYTALRRHRIPRRTGAHPLLLDAEWLRTQYLERGDTPGSIAADIGRAPSTIRKALRRYGIRKSVEPPPRRRAAPG